MISLEYAPGRAWCSVTPHAVAVFGPATPTATVLEARTRLARGGDPHALADAVGGMPGALTLLVEDRGTTLLRRFQNIPARLDGVVLSSADACGPGLHPLDGDAVELGLLDALSGSMLPVREGIVRVAALQAQLRPGDEPPGLVARAAEIEPAPSTDELPVFRAEPGRAPAASEPVLVLHSGERVPLDRGAVIGRRPQSDRTDGGPPPRLVTVGSLGTMISRTHLRVDAGGDGIHATDLQSTNGTSVARPGTLTQRLQPGIPTRLHEGDILNLGDGVAITISSGV